jgi:hypothetical protein
MSSFIQCPKLVQTEGKDIVKCFKVSVLSDWGNPRKMSLVSVSWPIFEPGIGLCVTAYFPRSVSRFFLLRKQKWDFSENLILTAYGSKRGNYFVFFDQYISVVAEHSGRAVWGMNCLRSLERWDRGFDSHSSHRCLCAFILCLCCSVCRQRPCYGLIPRPRSPTNWYGIKKLKKRPKSNKRL